MIRPSSSAAGVGRRSSCFLTVGGNPRRSTYSTRRTRLILQVTIPGNVMIFVWQYAVLLRASFAAAVTYSSVHRYPGTPILMTKIRPDLGHAHATWHASLVLHNLHSLADNTSDKAAQFLLPPSHPQSVLLNEQTQRLLRDSRDKPSTCQIISDLWA